MVIGMASTANNFQVVGKNIIILANMLLNNQNICKLLYYTTNSPLTEPNLTETDFLMNKNIRVIPKIPDEQSEKGSFIVILFNSFELNPENEKTVVTEISFDIICPIDEWVINSESLRPFLIMGEINNIFNGLQVKGIGKLQFVSADRISVSPEYAGYRMVYTNDEFN